MDRRMSGTQCTWSKASTTLLLQVAFFCCLMDQLGILTLMPCLPSSTPLPLHPPPLSNIQRSTNSSMYRCIALKLVMSPIQMDGIMFFWNSRMDGQYCWVQVIWRYTIRVWETHGIVSALDEELASKKGSCKHIACSSTPWRFLSPIWASHKHNILKYYVYVKKLHETCIF